MAVGISSVKYSYTLYYSPKSACSFIRQVFAHLHQDETGDCNYHQLPRCMPEKQTRHYLVFVRNPYHRAVSMYLDKYCKVGHEDIYFHKNHIPDLSFNGFLDLLNNNRELLETSGSVHFSKQSANIKKINCVVKCENYLPKLIEFYDRLKISKYAVINAINSVSIYNETNYGQILDIHASTRNFYHETLDCSRQSFLLDPKIRQKIYALYKEDFFKFNYSNMEY